MMKCVFVVAFASTLILAVSTSVRSVNDIRTELARTNYFEFQGRIINGQNAALGQFPYYVRITIYDVSVLIGWCGGTILRANWILTACHCVRGTSSTYTAFYIEAGSVTRNQPSQQASVVPPLLGAVYPHPGYNPATLMYDIGLIKTPGSFNLNGPNVKSIPLPLSSYSVALTYANQIATVCGFGLTANEGNTSPTLRYTTLKIITFDTCRGIYGTEPIPSTSFCGVDDTPPISAVCSGDSGGPIVLTINSVLTVIGVVSYASDLGCDAKPQGFTDILQFLTWINPIIGT
ncbi:hypothetical protein DMENIID0001_011160 [Sergentomyia squamirostris]